ncbi:MAG: dihydrodipicolinate synthase family protein [Spirochaetota bacterium]|nr:dihydrodipicolinate synthase family protein [Spirochaetota bacterium]
MEPNILLHGVFVSLVTPFVQEKISFELLEENVTKQNKTSVKGYLVLGGNGEYMSLSEDEQLKILSRVSKLKEDKKLICGVACESTHLTIERAKLIADYGVDLLRILPPHYFASRMTDEVLIRFYEEVADNSPVPFILYNVPKLTNGVGLSPEGVKRLAGHPRIIGIKDSSAEGIYGFLAATKNVHSFAVLAGSANIFLPALVSGAVGGDMSLANYLPDACCTLQKYYEEGRMAEARDLHLSLFKINKLVSGQFGVPGVKAAMDLTGYRGGEPRRPFTPLEKSDTMMIKSLLEMEGLLPHTG